MTDIFDDIFDEAGALGDVNTQTGKETDLAWKDYEFRTGVDESSFQSQALPRMAR